MGAIWEHPLVRIRGIPKLELRGILRLNLGCIQRLELGGISRLELGSLSRPNLEGVTQKMGQLCPLEVLNVFGGKSKSKALNAFKFGPKRVPIKVNNW